MNIPKLQSRRFLAASALMIIMLATTTQLAYAVAPDPAYGTGITVDGNPGEWNLVSDFFTNMYRAWNNSGPKPVEAYAYLRYDPNTNTMYVLVLMDTTRYPAITNGDPFVKIGNAVVVEDGSGNNGVPPDFAWVGIGYDGNATHAQGYEASFIIAPGDYLITIHTNLWDGAQQTSGTPGQKIPLHIEVPEFVVPETPFATTLVAVMAAAAVFMVYRRTRQKKP